MGFIVATFRISGDSPAKGSRITALLFTRFSTLGDEIARLSFPQNGSEPVMAAASFNRLLVFAGTDPVVTHDGYNWKRLLRQEFASQPKAQLNEMLARTIDVSQWSQQRFPRQRKDLNAICKRMQIVLPSELQGMEREVAALRAIAMRFQPELPRLGPTATIKSDTAPPQNAPSPTTAQPPLSLISRLRRAWMILVDAST